MTGKKDSTTQNVMRFQGLMGALVTMSVTDLGEYTVWHWRCDGCLLGNDRTDMKNARDTANEHAATCRALPPEQPTA